jgi:hypothetical protein
MLILLPPFYCLYLSVPAMNFLFRHLIVAVCLCGFAHAGVTRIEISERSTFADGKVFGPSGAYERLKGRMFIETDPQNQPTNASATSSGLRAMLVARWRAGRTSFC